jgi:predicted CoA-binding protein
MVDVDYTTRYGIVAVAGEERRIVATRCMSRPRHARRACPRRSPTRSRASGWARFSPGAEGERHSAGIDILEAVVKPENHKMINLLRESGFPVNARSEPGEVHAEIPTALTREGLRQFEDRERIAAVAAVTHLLAPASLAVIGASRQRGSIGAELLHNVVANGFTGRVYPVNPAATEIEGMAAYPSVGAIPGDVEMAVITVPAAAVVEVARQCAAKGVRALVVISAGFAETGGEGVELHGSCWRLPPGRHETGRSERQAITRRRA